MSRLAGAMRVLDRIDRRQRRSRAKVTRGGDPPTTVHASLPVVVGLSDRLKRETESGGRTVNPLLYEVHCALPADVRRGDVLTIIVTRDPLLVGRFLTVKEVITDDLHAVRVLVCQESRATDDE